jgi:hypothetical protein
MVYPCEQGLSLQHFESVYVSFHRPVAPRFAYGRFHCAKVLFGVLWPQGLFPNRQRSLGKFPDVIMMEP